MGWQAILNIKSWGGGHGPFRIAPTYEFDWGYIFEQVGKSLR